MFFVGLFGWTVWPTPWKERMLTSAYGRTDFFRENRFTGEVQQFKYRGWETTKYGTSPLPKLPFKLGAGIVVVLSAGYMIGWILRKNDEIIDGKKDA